MHSENYNRSPKMAFGPAFTKQKNKRKKKNPLGSSLPPAKTDTLLSLPHAATRWTQRTVQTFGYELGIVTCAFWDVT